LDEEMKLLEHWSAKSGSRKEWINWIRETKNKIESRWKKEVEKERKAKMKGEGTQGNTQGNMHRDSVISDIADEFVQSPGKKGSAGEHTQLALLGTGQPAKKDGFAGSGSEVENEGQLTRFGEVPSHICRELVFYVRTK
jgi:hypothetical protein